METLIDITFAETNQTLLFSLSFNGGFPLKGITDEQPLVALTEHQNFLRTGTRTLPETLARPSNNHCAAPSRLFQQFCCFKIYPI